MAYCGTSSETSAGATTLGEKRLAEVHCLVLREHKYCGTHMAAYDTVIGFYDKYHAARRGTPRGMRKA